MSIRIYVEGERALWTRPENKAERVSYPAMTFSSARNCLQAIYWKPSIEWVVESIEVLRPSRFISVKRNEVKSLAIKGKDDFYIEELRTQRYTLMLAGIKQEDAPQERPKLAYIINAHFRMTDLAGVSRKKWQEHTPRSWLMMPTLTNILLLLWNAYKMEVRSPNPILALGSARLIFA